MARRAPPEPPKLQRRAAIRQPKIALLIFCEGKNTEPLYLEAFANEYGNDLVRIKVVGPAGAPMTMVETAKSEKVKAAKSKNSFENFDQVWVIFDRDEHPKVDQAISEAVAAGLKVGFSNPCFEVWLLLHHGEYDAPDHRHVVQKKYAGLDSQYDPKGSKSLDYPSLSSGYQDACKRAVRMRTRREEEGGPMSEPYTDVDILTELIVANGRPGSKGR